MSETSAVPGELRGLWRNFSDAETVHGLRIWMWMIVGRINKEQMIPLTFIDHVLSRCAARPLLLSEQGLTIAMLASEDAREEFRARLVECGMYLEAMRLGETMKRRLSRDEVVALGNNHLENLDPFEVEKFVAYASVTEGMQLLDMLRIQKQFGIEVGHISL